MHDFWDTHPVPKAYETVDESMLDKPIDKDKKVEDVKQDPLTLPPGYEWSNIDITDREQCEEVYQLLT